MKYKSSLIISAKLIAGMSIVFGSLLVTSCLDDNYEELQQEEKDKIAELKSDWGITEADAIGSGVYLKFIERNADTSGPKAVLGNTTILYYHGRISSGDLLETTDSAIAAQAKIYLTFFIYGPARIKVGYSLPGINLALSQMREGDSAVTLIPSEMAWYNYDPVLYHLKLLKIIPNDTVFESSQKEDYAVSLGFTDLTTSTLKNTYTKIDAPGTILDTLHSGDSIRIGLKGYFAETGENMVPPGRMFFPRGNFTNSFTYMYGDPILFPITPAIDSTIVTMKIGEIREIITGSEYVYGSEGFRHPAGYTIVPPYMPIHYVIELKGIWKNEE